MPTSPRTRSARRDVRPTGRTAKSATRPRKKSPARRKPAQPKRPAAAASTLPLWSDLGSAQRKKSVTKKVLAKKARRARFLDAAPSLRFAVWVLVGCIAATLYVGHVFATQETLAALQQAERENLQLHLTHERLQGAYDRMTGPHLILERAAALGLEEGIAYGPTITLEN